MDTAPAPRPRVAVVTGANRGLGYALAAGLARQGLTVVLTARRLPDAEAAVAVLNAEGVQAHARELDITSAASVNRLFADVERDFGGLDVLINNAAVAIDRGQAPSQADIETVAATLDTNLVGTWRCCKQALRLMRKGGYGRIVNVSSHMASLALTDDAGSVAYRVSKTAVNQLTRALAAETRNEGIRVNCASPGTVKTRMGSSSAHFTPEQSADTMLRLALLPDDGPTGAFFYGHEELPW